MKSTLALLLAGSAAFLTAAFRPADTPKTQRPPVPFAGTPFADLPPVLQTSFKKDTFNLAKYGAVADGQALNTEAFRKAIEACAAGGGGTVLVPRGLWLTGPIVLRKTT